MSTDSRSLEREGSDARAGNHLGTRAVQAGYRGLESIRRGLVGAFSRPTASDMVTIGLVLATGFVVGGSLVGTRLAAVALTAGVAGGLVTVLLASRRPLVRALGAVLAVPIAVFVAIPVTTAGAFTAGVPGFGLFAGIAVGALVFSAYGVTLISWDDLGNGGVRRGAAGVLLTTVGVCVVILARLLPDGGARGEVGAYARDAAGEGIGLVVVADGSWAVLSFAGLLVVAAILSSWALAVLPLERFAPPDRREGVARTVTRIRRGWSLTIRIGVAIALASLVTPLLTDRFEAIPLAPAELRTGVPEPLGEALMALVTVSGLRVVLVALASIGVSILLFEWFRRALRRGLAAVLARVFAPVAGGSAVTLVLAQGFAESGLEDSMESILDAQAPQEVVLFVDLFPTFALAAVLLVLALFTLASVLVTVSGLRTIRVLPPRAIGSAVAACSIFALAIGLAVVGRVEPAILTATLAFVVWDVGEFADGLRTELGRGARTIRAELVHVGGSVLTGGVVTGGTIALYRWVATDAPIVDPRLAAVVVATGVLAVVTVAMALRG